MVAAARNHATSWRLRPTGACHSAATFRRASARLTQNVPRGPSTRQMSEDTPPLIGRSSTGWSALTSFIRASESTTSRYAGLPGGRGAATSAAIVVTLRQVGTGLASVQAPRERVQEERWFGT